MRYASITFMCCCLIIPASLAWAKDKKAGETDGHADDDEHLCQTGHAGRTS
jgi:hypothetical protein